ncbi:hypothetical protein B0H65DRAFT_437579 [Neurospora tetraspora]|uniref:Uncharacterized protein n=1 Tax=Neurospora tetraspora TaxID=94610 RepID=A0AAE0JMH0_9PEZI|nr:hypothetical protein B0H65DRAFT_437579 [Neurospora tetraspora]
MGWSGRWLTTPCLAVCVRPKACMSCSVKKRVKAGRCRICVYDMQRVPDISEKLSASNNTWTRQARHADRESSLKALTCGLPAADTTVGAGVVVVTQTKTQTTALPNLAWKPF